jgi:hypothetical protein
MNRINKPEVRRCHYVRAKKMNRGNPDNRIEIVVQTMTRVSSVSEISK